MVRVGVFDVSAGEGQGENRTYEQHHVRAGFWMVLNATEDTQVVEEAGEGP